MKDFKCLICGNADGYITVHQYSVPDKYEQWMGIQSINRSWVRCIDCGFYRQLRNYDISKLEKIYKRGYREKKFRGETIEEAFNRINHIANSENEKRYIWFAMHSTHKDTCKILDVGSGIGVFPYALKVADYDVQCVEENEISVDFIFEKLGLACYRGIEHANGLFDALSLIHVLEHIENPIKFLKIAKAKIKSGGYIFIEVPDSSEFNYLDKNHDEFNSCHTVFYDMGSLYSVLNLAGFEVKDMHIEKTTDRELTRIMCIATN